jgi:hypothetical protein
MVGRGASGVNRPAALLFCLFAVVNLWALPIGLLVAFGASRTWVPARAVFGEFGRGVV